MTLQPEMVQLGIQDILQLMKYLHHHLPEPLPIYYAADNLTRERLTSVELQFVVDTWPCPSCVVAVSPPCKGQLWNYRTTVDIWAKDPKNIKTVLNNSQLVDWTQPIFFRVLGETGQHQVQELISENSAGSSCVQRHIYVLGSLPEQHDSLKCKPPGFTLQSLSHKDAETVGLQYSAWGVDPADTIRYFQRCSLLLPSSCLYTSDGELVAYVALHHTSAFGSVFTDPKHQKKGYGQTVVTDICRKMLKDGQTPYVFVNPENIASVKLYQKCGFQFKAKAYRIRYIPSGK